MSEPVRVFVSYASPDRAFAQKLVASLQTSGAEVWWDVTGIDEGDFLTKINGALKTCPWFVLVLSPHAIASRWVELEVNAAIHRRQQGFTRGVLPVLAAPIQPGTVPPMWDNLHRYDAVRDYQGEIARLIRTLGLPGVPAEHSPAHIMPSDRFPPRLAELGYRAAIQGGVEIILPPLCSVAAGEFLMGVNPRPLTYRLHEDGSSTPIMSRDGCHPEHRVTLPPYQISRYPVTVAEYNCFVRTGHTPPQINDGEQAKLMTLDCPVAGISWEDASAYAAWLARITSQLWRLPTEAEWEKAARWNESLGISHVFPWGDALHWDSPPGGSKFNWSNDWNYGGATTPVGNFPTGASVYGLQDLLGSVSQWTSSLDMPYPYNANDGREQVESSLKQRVLRGGVMVGTMLQVGAAERESNIQFTASDSYGFRLAFTAPA
jgi:formylglycine-generating enzyme required for sulfatase activity